MYGKHFAQTYTGSMFGAGPVVFAVWGYVIANARRDGTVEVNAQLVAAALGASVEDVGKALSYLTSPDPTSRSKEHDGKRLLPLGEFLYIVPNYKRFNAMRNDDERRAYNRIKQQESRARRRVKVDVSRRQPPSAPIPVPVDIPVEIKTPRKRGASTVPATSWSAKAIDTWKACAGSPPVGPLVSALKPVYDELKDTDRLCYGLAKWLRAGNAKFGPAVFARDWRQWVPSGQDGRPKGNDLVMAEWLAKGADAHGP